MSEGHDWTRPPFAKKVYNLPFAKMLWLFVGLFGVVAIITTTFTHGPNVGTWHTRDFVFIAVATSIVPLLLTLFLYRFANVVLTPETVCTMNDFSVRQTMRLDRIARVSKPWYVAGLFLIVKEKEVLARLWIPLFMLDKGDFISSLSQVVPQDNPLRNFFSGQD